MKFNDIYNEKLEIFEAAKKKKKVKKAPNKNTKSKAKKKDDKVKDSESLVTDKLVFPTEERAILNLGDTISTVTQKMGDIEQEIKDAVKAKDKAKADQLERQIDEYKEKLEKLTDAEKKAIDSLKAKIDELLKCTDDEEYKKLLTSVKKKY